MTELKRWEKFCSSTRSQDDGHTQQGAVTQDKLDWRPSVPFEHHEQDERQFHLHSPLTKPRK